MSGQAHLDGLDERSNRRISFDELRCYLFRFAMERARKTSDHNGRRPKEYKKVRKSLVTSGFPENPVISFSVLRAIKTPDCDKKSGVFLTFLTQNGASKMGLELVLELVAETPKT